MWFCSHFFNSKTSREPLCVRVTGQDDSFDEGNRVSAEFTGKYFSQLTVMQILELYQVYKIDFDIFDYSPKPYLELAKDF